MLKKTKGMLFAVVLLVFSIALSACGAAGNASGTSTAATPAETAAGTGTAAAPAENAAGTPSPATSETQNASYPIVEETITFTMMGQTHPMLVSDWSQNKFFERMEALTNVHFEAEVYDGAVYGEKKSLAFASDELPDVFFKAFLTAQDEMMYGSQGMLIELEGLIDQYAPNLKKILDESPMVRRTITTPSGHIYSLPCVYNKDNEAGNTGNFWINKKWLEALDMDVPETAEELYNVLKAFQEKDPNANGTNDEIPMTLTGTWDMKWLLHAFGLNLQDWNSYVDESGTVTFGANRQEYKEALKYLNKLYTEKLIDQETFTQTRQQEWAKGKEAEEVFGMFFDAAPWLVVGNERNEDYVILPPLTSEFNDKMFFPSNVGIERGLFAITNKCENPEVAMRWIDALYAPEYSRWAIVGMQGEEWDWLDEDETSWDYIIPTEEMDEIRGQITIQPGGGMPYMAPSYDGFWQKQRNPIEAYVIAQKDTVMKYGSIGYPMVYFDDDTQKQINSLNTDISTYVDQMFARFVTGDASIDGEWDAYIKQLDDMGLAQFVQILQERYNDYSKN